MKNYWMLLLIMGLATSALAQDAPPKAPPPEAKPADAKPADAEQDEPEAEAMDVNLSGADVNVQVIGGDTLILSGVEEDLAILQALIDRLDRDVPQKDYRVVVLQRKNAAEVAKVVEQVMSEFDTTTEPRPEDQLAINTVSNNILLITGPTSKLETAEAIVRQVDLVDPSLPEFDQITYRLNHVKAAEAKRQLDEMIAVLRRMQGEDATNEIVVVPLPASNSLFVIAPKTTHEKIRTLIEEIDVEPEQGFGDLKLAYFPLLHSEAVKLADVLNELFAAADTKEDLTETIRRIRMIKATPGADGKLEELPPINLERQIKLIPDEESQALICATAEENIEPLRALIDMLDGVPLADEQALRVFALKHADADKVRELLEDMFQKGKDLTAPAGGGGPTKGVPDNAIGKSLVYNVGISADPRTNVLVVTGKTEQLLLIEGVIQKVDVPDTEIKHPLRLITLVNTDATRMSKIIEDLWEKRIEIMQDKSLGDSAVAREKVFLSVELRSNSLIVSATDDNFHEIETIVQTLDAAPDRWSDQIRILPCSVASAADLKGKIDELWQRKNELRGESDIPQDTPVVVADQRSNCLVIASGPDDFDEIKRLVEKLESQPLAPIAEIRLLTLKNNDASQIGDMLQQLFEERLQQRLANGQEENPSDRVAVAADAATNTILVASSKDNYDEMLRIIDKLDIEPDLEGVVRIFPLENAQAESVTDKITELFDKGLYTGVVTSDNQISQERQKVALVADQRSNAVIASASKTNLGIIEKLIEQMDTDRAPMLNADTRIFSLRYADAVKLADMLDKLFDGMAGGSDGDFTAPTIVPESSSNTLIMTGSRDAIKRATDLLAALDIESDKRTAIRVYSLAHGSAASLSAKIQSVFENRDQGADTQHTPVVLLPDELTNSLICSASAEDHSVIQHMLDLLDVESTISRRVQVFPLKRAKAQQTSETLTQLFESQAKSGTNSTGGPAESISVQPDLRTNSLIVWAAQTEMDNIAKIIEKLDTSEPGIEMMVKVIPLRRALAEELADTLVNTLTGGQQQSSGNDSEAVILSFHDTDADGNTIVRKLLRQDITIEPDPVTNSLFVLAPAGSMEMLESLILSIDRIKPSVAAIEMFPLQNADAQEVVDMLTALFEEQKNDQQGPEQRLELGGTAAAMAAGQNTAPGQVLRFTANRRTNTVIAAGSQTDLDMVGDLIRQLDSQNVEDRIRLAYYPKYIPAADMATAIKGFFEEENGLYDELDDQSSIMRRAERHITVVSDEDSNTLILGTSPRNYEQTMEMLYSIDRPPPQVLIEVLIAEVRLDDRLEFGMEFALQDLLFSENATVGPNGVVKGNDFDFVGGVDVGAAGSGSLGGFSFAITGEDFSFLVRALQSDGSLKVLSHPTIMVENNEEANITIGDQVPIVQGSQFTDTGSTQTSISYEDVGIILQVTPHINPDGYVNLEVKPEISSLNQSSSVQISEGLVAPVFQERSVETVVTVKDGETVVIGGLIQEQEDDSESKVPIVGDLPVVGNLFRAQQNSRVRTELLMVLTVNVVWDEFDAHEHSVRIRDQSGFMPESMKRHELMGKLRILPGDDYDERVPAEKPVRRPQPDMPQYGPAPETYGPATPSRSGGETTAVERYGPPRTVVASKSVVLSSSEVE